MDALNRTCCSDVGWCGGSKEHCGCKDCLHFVGTCSCSAAAPCKDAYSGRCYPRTVTVDEWAEESAALNESALEDFRVSGLDTHDSLAAALPQSDVLYVTRVQKERFPTAEAYDAVRGAYVVDRKALDSAPKDCIVMHPLPRVDEIATDVDADPRAKYFEQMENGMYVRMALLTLVLGADLSALPP